MKIQTAPRDLTQGAIWKQLFLFSIPILLCNLFQQLYSTVDAAIVGSSVGSDALAAVGSTGSLISLIVGFFMGLSSGASVVVSRFYGAHDDENVALSVRTSFALAILCGIFLTIFGYFASPFLLRVMKCPENVIGMSETYLKILFLGMIPNMIYNIGAGILRAVGDSRNPLIYLVISGVINFFLDLLLVAVIPLGVAGAAIATIISQAAAAVMVSAQLMRTEGALRLRWRELKLDRSILLSVVRIGVPAGLQSMLYAISNMLIQTNINSFGSDAMAGCAAYGKIDGFLYMPLNAFGLAATTFTGQNMGAQKHDRVKRGALVGVGLGASTSLAGAAIVLAVAPMFVSIFTKGNAEAVRYARMEMFLIAPFYCIFAPTEVLSGVIRGAGSALTSTLITASTICAFRVGMITLFMPYFHDIRLVFAAYPASWLLCSATFIIYYKFGKWIK
ncbi:MAG: MATE family efflux transporter [Eubacteriales bacterium]